jgi:hypothetical protein
MFPSTGRASAGLDDVVEQLPVIAHNQFEIVVPLSGGITHAPR